MKNLISIFLQVLILLAIPFSISPVVTLALLAISVICTYSYTPDKEKIMPFLKIQAGVLLITSLAFDIVQDDFPILLLFLAGGVLLVGLLGVIITTTISLFNGKMKSKRKFYAETTIAENTLLLLSSFGLLAAGLYFFYFEKYLTDEIILFLTWSYWISTPFTLIVAHSKLFIFDKLKAKGQILLSSERLLKEPLLEKLIGATPKQFNQFKDNWDTIVSNSEQKPLEEPVNWLTLDEQYEYLKGLNDKIKESYFSDFTPLFNESFIEGNANNNVINAKLIDKGYAILENHANSSGLTEEEIEEEDGVDKKIVRDYVKSADTGELSFYDWNKEFKSEIEPLLKYLRGVVKYNDIDKDFERIEAGILGENALEKSLNMFDKRFKILTNVRVVVDGTSAESDALIISPFGVVTVEAKNFGSHGKYSIHVSKDGKWTKIEGRNRTAMKDVIEQSNRHVMYKQQLINDKIESEGLAKDFGFVEIEGIITITNDRVVIDNESDFVIKRLSSMYEHLRKQPVIYTDEQVDFIYNVFKDNMQEAQRFPITDYEKQYEQLKHKYSEHINAHKELIKLVNLED